VSDRAQYGELMRVAGARILAASLVLQAQAIDGEVSARSAAVAYRDLLHALARHGRELFGGESNMWAVRAAINPDQRDAVGARLIDHLAHVAQRDMLQEPKGELAVAWQEGARSVRAATDLLSTLHDRRGGWRTPEAALLENPSIRAAGFGELASVTIPVGLAADGLGRRLEEVGFDDNVVHELVPETANLREVAYQTRKLANLSGFGRPLSTLEVARPAVRSEDPHLELTDRVARLHRVAWQLTKEEWVGVCSLADLAVAGIVVHEAAAGQMRLASTAESGPPDISVRRALSRFEEGAAAWRTVHVQLRQLRTATPVVDGLRGDVVAVRRLLGVLAAEEPNRRTQRAVISAAGRFGEIAVWNVEAVETQGKKNRIYIPGRFLTGNQVSDEPVLVRAKLKGTLAPLQKEQVLALRSAYDAAKVASCAADSLAPEPSGMPGGGPLRSI
jgi:hypothetical protein